MYVNDKYLVDVILMLLSNSDSIFDTPKDYCVSYSYEETHSITLEDLRGKLNDILVRYESNEK